jgi:agarase
VHTDLGEPVHLRGIQTRRWRHSDLELPECAVAIHLVRRPRESFEIGLRNLGSAQEAEPTCPEALNATEGWAGEPWYAGPTVLDSEAAMSRSGIFRGGGRGALWLGLFSALALVTPVQGQVQSDDQRRCIRTLNQGFERMLKKQAGEARRCLKDAAKERREGSLAACLQADAKGRVDRTRFKNIKTIFKHCVEAPDFGPPDAATSNATGIQSQLALLLDVFGSDLDAAIARKTDSKDTVKCQQAVYKAVDSCQRAKLTSFRRCIKKGLADGSVASEAGLAACAELLKTPGAGDPIPYSKIARLCGTGRIQKRVEKRCQAKNVDLAEAFPGCAGGDAGTVARCLDRSVECQVCLALNRVDFLDRDCDAFDDGDKNGSCLGADRWGGHTSIESTATDRFRVEEIDGVWYYITPDGHGFFSAGINNVSPDGDFSPPIGTAPYGDNILALYGSQDVWQEVTYERMQRWNFNTMGAFGPTSIHVGRRPYTPVSSFHSGAPEIPGWPAGQTGKRVRDFFDPGWPAAAAARAEELRYCAEDPFCIGVYSDNELPWGPSVFMVGTFMDAYMSLPANAPGKLELQAFFEERYVDVAAFNAVWGLGLVQFNDLQDLDSMGSDLVCEEGDRTDDRRAFMVRVAERYFGGVHDALRALNPDMLILGSRFTTTSVGPDVIQVAAPYLDVIALNHYLLDAGALNVFAGNGGLLYEYFFLDNRFDDLAQIHALAGLPLMITEYSVRTPTPDVSVLFPPFFPTYDTQEERTDAYEEYQRQILARPFMIGTHWFEYWDQPATGRGDGENSRFGVVNIEDTPYEEITQRMTLLNGLTPDRPLPEPEVVFFPDPGASVADTTDFSDPNIVISAAVDGALGTRLFSIAPSGSDRTGFYIGLLPGQNLGSAVTGGPLVLEAGIPDARTTCSRCRRWRAMRSVCGSPPRAAAEPSAATVAWATM